MARSVRAHEIWPLENGLPPGRPVGGKVRGDGIHGRDRWGVEVEQDD